MRSVAPIRPLAWGILLLSGLFAGSCASRPAPVEDDTFAAPNPIMGKEIRERVAEIEFQHRDELYENLVWLVQRGETAISAVLEGLQSETPKVRSSCAWVLGEIRDRRTIPALREVADDESVGVRLEVARSLVKMGDLSGVPALIEGLDNDKVQVRYYCHAALKNATGHEFGYDHLTDDRVARARSVYDWRVWWAEQSQDPFFASNYAEQHGLDTGEAVEIGGEVEGQPAAPATETAPEWMAPDGDEPQDAQPQAGSAEPVVTPPQPQAQQQATQQTEQPTGQQGQTQQQGQTEQGQTEQQQAAQSGGSTEPTQNTADPAQQGGDAGSAQGSNDG